MTGSETGAARRRKMFQKLIETVLELTSNQGFESYLRNLQKNGAAGLPTRDEALKDYQSAIRPH
jgi:gamma-glutamyl:cysteine ligase YbdK (ATP-grasp superfamily)